MGRSVLYVQKPPQGDPQNVRLASCRSCRFGSCRRVGQRRSSTATFGRPPRTTSMLLLQHRTANDVCCVFGAYVYCSFCRANTPTVNLGDYSASHRRICAEATLPMSAAPVLLIAQKTAASYVASRRPTVTVNSRDPPGANSARGWTASNLRKSFALSS